MEESKTRRYRFRLIPGEPKAPYENVEMAVAGEVEVDGSPRDLYEFLTEVRVVSFGPITMRLDGTLWGEVTVRDED